MMRKLIICFIVLFCINYTSIAQTTYVISIGVSKYVEDENNLTQTTKDVKSFCDIMRNHTDKITLLTSRYANRDNILQKLEKISKLTKDKDKIIIFYSGHGFPGGIFPYDQPINYQEINDILVKAQAKEKICIFNACHTGSVAEVKDGFEEYKIPSSGNLIYMMSCRANEYSYEDPIAGHCIFTTSLLKGLRGKADANNDKKITVKELFNYVYNDVIHTTSKIDLSQHPQLIGMKTMINAIVVDWYNKSY